MAPGRMALVMGGTMGLVTGARRVVVAMQHTARGKPKIVPSCSPPLTSTRRLTLVVTRLAAIEPTDAGLALRERAPASASRTVSRRPRRG